MKPGNFKVNYENEQLSATIAVRPSLSLKIALYFLNILLISIIILFTIGGVGVIVLFILAFEILVLRYSIWNIYGAETIVLTLNMLSYQQHYGFLKLPVKSFHLNHPIRIIPFHENFQAGNQAMKLIFESLDESNEPVNLYQTALVISRSDYALLMQSLQQLQAKAS